MLCEVLIVTGRPDDAAQVALDGLERAHTLGVERSFGALLAGYAAEGLLETGDWDRADALLTKAHRTGTRFWGHYPRLLNAQLAVARGRYAAARQHIAAGSDGERQPTSAPRYARVVAELAIWEGRPDQAARTIDDALVASEAGRSPVHAMRLGVLGLWAAADRAQLAARDRSTVDEARRYAHRVMTLVRQAAADAMTVTPDATAWLALAEAEYSRLEGHPDPEYWRAAVVAWDDLARPYAAAYCRWRLAEGLLADGSPGRRIDAVAAARGAYRVATNLAAAPLRKALEQLALRARLDLEGLPVSARRDGMATLGLTAREGEVLLLLSRGYTNREIGAELTISVKTASVHVSHILRKLGVERRVDAAAIGQRLQVSPSPPPDVGP
jgi:DNA-binding NarL/FixJ family response regulator